MKSSELTRTRSVPDRRVPTRRPRTRRSFKSDRLQRPQPPPTPTDAPCALRAAESKLVCTSCRPRRSTSPPVRLPYILASSSSTADALPAQIPSRPTPPRRAGSLPSPRPRPPRTSPARPSLPWAKARASAARPSKRSARVAAEAASRSAASRGSATARRSRRRRRTRSARSERAL